MTELDRVAVEGEVVEHEDVWEEAISEWTTGASQAIVGQLRQARAAANVSRVHGRASMKKFAEEVGVSKTTVYDYARVWQVYGHLIEDGDTNFSRRVESGYVNMAQLVAKAYSNDPLENPDEIGDKSSRAIEAENREQKELEAAEDPRAEKIEETRCGSCGAPSSAWERPPVEVAND